MFANTGCTSAHCTFWHNWAFSLHETRGKHFLPHGMSDWTTPRLPRLKIVTVWGLPGHYTINRGHLRDKESLGNSYRSLLEFCFCECPAYALMNYLVRWILYKWPRVTKSQNSPFCPASAFKWNSHNLYLLVTHTILIWLERARWAKLLFWTISA